MEVIEEGYKLHKKLRKWWKRLASEDGAYTVEASIIFPVVFYCCLAMLFFAMLMFQHVMSSHAATLAAERGAAFWDNSYKDATTGSHLVGKHDGLYWRMLDDYMLDRLLGVVTGRVTNEVSLPVSSDSESLPEKKLIRVGRLLPPIFHGEMKFENIAIERKVTVSLERPLYQTAFERLTRRRVSGEGGASAAVVEPVEFIRSVEFARYMSTKLAQWNKKGISNEQAADTIKRAAK